MTNAEKFKQMFGIYSEEFWSMSEKEMLEFINAEYEEPWILCSERMPLSEQEVLICTKKRKLTQTAYIESLVIPAIYEDGTVLENDSGWRWEDVDYADWDEEEDCGIIPEGWWENRHFNPDDVYNNPVDEKVVAWMPLPELYHEGEQDQ